MEKEKRRKEKKRREKKDSKEDTMAKKSITTVEKERIREQER
jgi:hypothetical protein